MLWNLKQRIHEKYTTQSDFAEALDVNESIVSQIIRERRKLSKAKKSKWAKMLKCSVKSIFNTKA